MEEKRFKDEPPIKKRTRDLRRKYGITLEQYNDLFRKQNESCSICKTHQSDLPRILSVDHCHDTGAVRGLLCDNCNRGLGLLGDNLESIKVIVSYLSSESKFSIPELETFKNTRNKKGRPKGLPKTGGRTKVKCLI